MLVTIGGAEGSCLTARAHVKQGNLHKFLSARACSLSRALPAQGCILLGAATGKKKPNPKVRFSLLVVELRGVEPLSEKL